MILYECFMCRMWTFLKEASLLTAMRICPECAKGIDGIKVEVIDESDDEE